MSVVFVLSQSFKNLTGMLTRPRTAPVAIGNGMNYSCWLIDVRKCIKNFLCLSILKISLPSKVYRRNKEFTYWREFWQKRSELFYCKEVVL